MDTEVQSEVMAYLLGLIAGRGHFYTDSKRIAIEFSHANKRVAKILHCHRCGDLVTGFTVLKCKKCGTIHQKTDVITLEQIESTKSSIEQIIIPYLSQQITAGYNLVTNPSMTLLVLDFGKNSGTFEEIHRYFAPHQSFDSFHIPQAIKQSDRAVKTEFVNGLLDTAGFNNAGGWLPRNGVIHGRMRSYFQIVRNWHMPVEIDNFLRQYFSLPIQTVDWGHPNIRDSKLRDYYESGTVSWSREHQVKFFPEYYTQFRFRLKHKQELFEDLIAHNQRAEFDRAEDWFPPSRVREIDLKPYHPGETDLRIPEPARRHFDRFWQVNAAMGCEFMKQLTDAAVHPGCLLKTGVDEPCDKARDKAWEQKRQTLTDDIHAQYAKTGSKAKATKQTAIRSAPEQALYAPLTTWLKEHLTHTYKQPAEAFDVSSDNLNQFISRNKDLLAVFDYCNNYRIKPDIVGFLAESKELAFIEAKVTSLSLKEVGQLLGYCLVANPVEAWLVSTKNPSLSLIRILQSHPTLLSYSKDRQIQIGIWEDDNLKEIKV